MKDRFEKLEKIVEKLLLGIRDSSHDMDHVARVFNFCRLLAKNEKVDQEVLRAATLLHDIGKPEEEKDKTGRVDHAILGAKMAAPILKKLGFAKEKIKHIQECIISHRYRTRHRPKTIEAKILFDADKLDTIGVIGLARGFIWVGKHNAKIYSKVNLNKYVKENLGGKRTGKIIDKSKHSPQLQYKTKDKYVLQTLNTKKAREIAKERLKFTKLFLDRLEEEVKGIK
jgi:uncharacterized protein